MIETQVGEILKTFRSKWKQEDQQTTRAEDKALAFHAKLEPILSELEEIRTNHSNYKKIVAKQQKDTANWVTNIKSQLDSSIKAQVASLKEDFKNNIDEQIKEMDLAT